MILNAAKYRSQFGGLWTDMANAHEEVQARLDRGWVDREQAELLNFWIDKGYVIIPNAVPHDAIDGIVDFIEEAWKSLDSRLKVETVGRSHPLNPAIRHNPGYRIVDIYAFCLAALEAMFAEKITNFLKIVFEQDILAFQTLSFERGTEQSMHQDPTYVVLSSPMKMAASWIALEDIEPGSGELVYYEGSHKIEEFLFEGRYKNWNFSDRDLLDEYLQSLHTKSKAMNLPLKKFQAKKGDALIWSADLVHGGSKITHSNSNITRRSLVTHYCPYSVEPGYFRHFPEHRVKKKFQDGCYYSSSHYIPSMEKFLDGVTLNSVKSSGLEVSPNSEILSVEVEKLRNKVKLLQSMVEAMQSSKFWQMRRAWFKVKRALGFKANE